MVDAGVHHMLCWVPPSWGSVGRSVTQDPLYWRVTIW